MPYDVAHRRRVLRMAEAVSLLHEMLPRLAHFQNPSDESRRYRSLVNKVVRVLLPMLPATIDVLPPDTWLEREDRPLPPTMTAAFVPILTTERADGTCACTRGVVLLTNGTKVAPKCLRFDPPLVYQRSMSVREELAHELVAFAAVPGPPRNM